MKSHVFFLSLALVILQSQMPAFAHEEQPGGFYTTDPTREDGVLSQFAVDLKEKTVMGLKDLAVKASGQSRIELRISELILTHSSTRVVHCLACKGDHDDLKRIAQLSNIENFLEVHYQATKEHQELAMRIFRVKDQKEVWKKTYLFDEEESRNTHVEVYDGLSFAILANAQMMPQEVKGYMSVFGLGARVKQSYWALEFNAERSSAKDSVFHLLVIKSWRAKTNANELWLGAGASYLTGDSRSLFSPAIRAGYDWHFQERAFAGAFLGGRPITSYGGLEIGVRIGFIF